MFQLRVSPAEGEVFDVDVDGEELFVGRSTSCDITIADRYLSRRHARLFSAEDGWKVEDLGSRNGTHVNGQRIDDASAITFGDVLFLSASTIEVRKKAAAGAGSDIATDVPSSDRLLKPAADVLRRATTPPPGDDSEQASALRRHTERLALLNNVHQAMSRSITLGDLLELILDHIFAQLQPERAEVFMRCSDGGYTCVASRAAPASDLRSLYSESLFSEVVNESMAALVTDARSDQRFAKADSLLSTGVRTLLAAPLSTPDQALGLIVLGSNTSRRSYTEEDLDLLITLASIAGMRINNLALTQEAAEQRRFQHELTIARRLQVALIPEQLPSITGYQVYGATAPSRVVSGDYYQVIEREDGNEVVLALADVSGKGISAALLTGYLEAVSSVPIEDGLPPHEVFNRVSNKIHARTLPNRFATMFLGVLTPVDATLRFASAGHAPACLVRSSGGVDWLGSTGVPLGLLPDAAYQHAEIVLDAGDTLVVYSDGYTEAENPAGCEFGQKRLADVIDANSRLAPNDLAVAVDVALESFVAGRPFTDDRTIVVVRRTA
ncbi:MAG: SpoIIE family protein phosphatase [Thermoanaerobaculales bacterium]|jgi:serine phosphatase RsbU (regulator of sigma subunit)|nr:SpoIIE family protein phosphatase [Thermoanaerobaculales bacterium]